MSVRLLVLDLMGPAEGQGLAAHLTAGAGADVSIFPIATGFVRAGDNGAGIVVTPARSIAAGLEAAFSTPVDGMLIGTLASYWQVKALAAALTRSLPETLVFAPFGAAAASVALSSYSRRLLLKAVLPEATVVVAPASRAGELLQGAAAGKEAQARAIVESGAGACWIRDDGAGARVVDVLAWESQTGLLDCPPPQPTALPETAVVVLAALLARGIPLREAIERAQAAGAGLGSEAHLAVR